MNKQRRKELESIKESVSKVIADVESIMTELEMVKDEEIDSWESMPESLQESERGSVMQENVTVMEDAYSDLETAFECLNTVQTSLEDVQ